MQTILGSGGIIANELAKVLREQYTDRIRLVARSPKKCHPEDELFPADLTNRDQTFAAIAGSKVAYLTIGLPYKAKTWSLLWPIVMKNVIDGCAEHGVKLVFFDNIYMYDPDHLSNMDETTPLNPISKKGAVRKEIAEMLLNAVSAGKIEGLIARCADYYGSGIKRNSMLNETIVQNYATGKAAQWLGPIQYRHSFTHVIDAAKGTAMLGNTADAFGQVWHLPTKSEPLTAEAWINKVADYFGVQPKTQLLTPFLASFLGLFIPVLREIKEMMYQYNRDYIFDSSKFEKRFNYSPVSYEEGIKNMLETDYPR